LKREVIHTSDGSTTIFLPELGETYHSKFGAIQEARHVFIKNGLSLFERKPLAILEIGFGTGLNAFITFLESLANGQIIDYVGVEAYPVEAAEVRSMNYASELDAGSNAPVFEAMHEARWGIPISLSDTFTLTKRQQFFHDIEDVGKFDLIYFDAFGYQIQPELWSTEIFSIMFRALKQNGILTTYAARSPIKKSMLEASFRVEKLAGPPGKREMFRAIKE
jgi:tRNA U34 5-methylaminomethyl-2-thiouridine-forming methyltransferase MnmC